jgi:3',5'-cyclic-AMP phosphodiesterase
MVHTGAVDYTLITDANSQGGRRREAFIKGLYIEVKDNNVVIKRRNIKENQWIFTEEVITLSHKLYIK